MTRQPLPAQLADTTPYTIIQGDCLQTLKTLPSCSVQMACTSPPYFGLRDYLTATWEGGDPTCNHEPDKTSPSSTLQGGKATQGSAKEFRGTCPRCGARRVDAQIGLEETPDCYVAKLVEVFREVRRVLHPTGVLWLNLGDSYNGSGGAGGDYSPGGIKKGQPKYPGRNVNGLGPKQLLGIPWRVAFALQDDGWILRSEVIWHKKAPMPESVTDRPTKAHEQLFLLAKSPIYYYDAEAIAEQATQPVGVAQLTGQHKRGHLQSLSSSNLGTNQGASTRNKRSVWTLGPESFNDAHFATMPAKLVEPCILAGSKPGDTVLDPFCGAATTLLVALKHGRRGLGLELNADYIAMSHKRLLGVASQQRLFEVMP